MSSPFFRSFLAALALAGFLFPAGYAADEPRLVITRPKASEALFGKATIAFVVLGAEEDEVQRAQISIDGRLLVTLTQPPWRADLDAGEEMGARSLEIVATLRDGRTVRAQRVTKPLAPLTGAEVRLVTLGVTVTDASGRPVKDLLKQDFQVFDGGRLIKIRNWEPAPSALAIALVLDTSASMAGNRIRTAQEAATEFVRALGDKDEATIIAFADEAKVVSPLTLDRERTISTIRTLRAKGGTSLYDAVFKASTLLGQSDPDMRRVMILLSDGKDEAASGLEPGSFHTLDEAIKAAHGQDVAVFSLGLGSRLAKEMSFDQRMTTEEVLTRLARSTGGRYDPVKRVSRLGKAYRRILEELRHQYLIAYSPPTRRAGEGWRAIEVKIARPGVHARTREGYFAR